MDISIIIPTYKPQDYIWECLHSINLQTLPKSTFEVLIILNGCKEPYYSKITSFLHKNFQDMNFRVIHTDTKGVSNARNVGIEAAHGKYLTFIDDDDSISPRYLQEMYEIAEKGILPISNILAFHMSKENIVPYYATEKFRKYYKETSNIFQVRSLFSVVCCKLVASDIIGNRRFNTHFNNGEDSLFMFGISDKINTISKTSDQAIYYRRIRPNSATTSAKSQKSLFCYKFKIQMAYFKLWMKNPLKYNFLFFISRLVAAALVNIRHLLGKNKNNSMQYNK